MNIKLAAEKSLERTPPKLKPMRAPNGEGLNHAKWLLTGILMGYIEGEKAHRWLGYAQAIMVNECVITLDDAKQINKESK